MKYLLTEATGNTFLLIDALNQPIEDFSAIHQSLIEEDRDDALILTEGSIENEQLTIRMLVLGRDGTFGEFCANGSRSVAAYLQKSYPTLKQFYLKTARGLHELKCYGSDLYSITLPKPLYALNPQFISDKEQFRRKYDYQYVEMIEPHLVIKGDLSDETLFALGRDLNKNKELFPLGINLNAWHELENGAVFVKTYERGVQRLTKSCGTGSMSCAALLNKDTLSIETIGGKMKIQKSSQGLELIGPVTL